MIIFFLFYLGKLLLKKYSMEKEIIWKIEWPQGLLKTLAH